MGALASNLSGNTAAAEDFRRLKPPLEADGRVVCWRKRVAFLICVLSWLTMTGAFGQTFLKILDDPLPQAGASFGFRVIKLSDVDGDGVPDFAVGAPNQGQVSIIS